jgi:hypothetical protein
MFSFFGRLKPINGFGKVLHFLLRIILPILVLILVRLDFVQLALIVVVLSKWRMFAVKPRFWLANILANSIDLVFGLSLVYFITYASSNIYWQLIWVLVYIIWLIFIKPAESVFLVSVQAFIGQFVGLTAIYLFWPNGSIWGLMILVGLICYMSARHFLNSFNEVYMNLISFFWAYVGISLAWLTSHWLVYYKVFSQPVMLLSILGYGLAIVYYLDHFKKYKKFSKIEITAVFIISLIIIVFYSSWTYKVV